MKPKPRALFPLACSAICLLASCSAVRNVGKGSVAMVKKSTSATVSTLSSVKMPRMPDLPLVHLLPGQGPKVVEVREKDLKEMPTGKELAIAHESKRRNNFWIFGGPVDFKEPKLPEPGSDLDNGLLPPPVE